MIESYYNLVNSVGRNLWKRMQKKKNNILTYDAVRYNIFNITIFIRSRGSIIIFFFFRIFYILKLKLYYNYMRETGIEYKRNKYSILLIFHRRNTYWIRRAGNFQRTVIGFVFVHSYYLMWNALLPAYTLVRTGI